MLRSRIIFLLYYNILITAILFVLMLICMWNLFILRRKKYTAIADKDLPFVSVLIPARNEEHNISAVVRSLLNQDYPNYEVIVLNDSSEDNTGSILKEICAEYPQLKVLAGKELEPGWTGKCFACKQLFEASEGSYILFTDADTVHYKNSLRHSVTSAIYRKADMLTLFPKMKMVSFAERIIMPLLWFTVMLLLPFYFVDKKGFVKFSIGIGPFMLFKRSAYEKIGGHTAVKNAIVEDVWLARKIKECGLQLIVEDGQYMLEVRMYRNLKEIWNGFSKNIFAGFEFSSIALFSVNLLYFLLFFLPFLLFFYQLSLGLYLNINLILLLFQVIFLYFCRTIISARFKLGFISSVLHPLGALSVPVIALNSWRWIKASAGAKWKGRVYNPVKNKTV